MLQLKFGSSAVIIVLLIALLFASIVILKLSINYKKIEDLNIIESLNIKEKVNVQKPSPRIETSGKCKSEFLQQDDFLEKYVVKKGDTLLSIAKSELKDPSRVNELIQLNQSNYPEISLGNPFIEVGWSLYLPPGDVVTSGVLGMRHAEIIRIEKTYWVTSHHAYLKLTPKTEFKGKSRDQYNVHDCITYTYMTGHNSVEVIWVSPQQ